MKPSSMTGQKAPMPSGGATLFACAKAAGNKVFSGTDLRQAGVASESGSLLLPVENSSVMGPESVLLSVSETP